jgi:hypothetical protein
MGRSSGGGCSSCTGARRGRLPGRGRCGSPSSVTSWSRWPSYDSGWGVGRPRGSRLHALAAPERRRPLRGPRHRPGTCGCGAPGRRLQPRPRRTGPDQQLRPHHQLSTTDRGHLGQLVTYAAGTDARTIVWISPSFREEHRQALDFLNDLGGQETRFFGVEISLVRIGDSVPAPLIRLRAQPNDWHAQVTAATRSTAEQAGKAPLYRQFWTPLPRARQGEAPWLDERDQAPDPELVLHVLPTQGRHLLLGQLRGRREAAD